MPCEWLRLIRNSMMNLAPQFSSNRMVREYVEQFYHPAAIDFKKRRAKRGELAKQLHHWYSTLQSHWEQILRDPHEFTSHNRVYQSLLLSVDMLHPIVTVPT